MSLLDDKSSALYEEAKSAIKDYLVDKSREDKRLKELNEKREKLAISFEKKVDSLIDATDKILNKEGLNIYISNKSHNALNLINNLLEKYRDTAPTDFEEFKNFCYSSNELIEENIENYMLTGKPSTLSLDFRTPSDFNRYLNIISFKDLIFKYTLFGEDVLSISNSTSSYSDSCKVEPTYASRALDRISFDSVEEGERMIETYEKIDKDISEKIKNPEALEKELVSSFYVCLERLNNITEEDLLPKTSS